MPILLDIRLYSNNRLILLLLVKIGYLAAPWLVTAVIDYDEAGAPSPYRISIDQFNLKVFENHFYCLRSKPEFRIRVFCKVGSGFKNPAIVR